MSSKLTDFKSLEIKATLMLDFWDDLREGILQISVPACELYVETVHELHNPDGVDTRILRARVVATGTFESVERLNLIEDFSLDRHKVNNLRIDEHIKLSLQGNEEYLLLFDGTEIIGHVLMPTGEYNPNTMFTKNSAPSSTID
jgi:hypothetical protein